MIHQRHVSVPLVDDDGPPRTPAWMDMARCRGMDPDLFMPKQQWRSGHDRSYHPQSFSTCARCEVCDDCLTHALERCEQGVWGGTTDAERRQIRRYKETT